MRSSQWFLGLATTSAIIAAVASGCGGSTSGGSPEDSGTADVTTDHSEAAAAEAAAETGTMDAAPEACAVDANLASLMVPDASIGDAGATTSGCLSCIQANCSSGVTACSADCACDTAVVGLLGCVASGESVVTCGEPLLTGGDATETALLACLAGPLLGGSGPGCLTQCGYAGMGDGGKKEGGGEGGGGGDGGDAAPE
jgi:hypothetical protein